MARVLLIPEAVTRLFTDPFFLQLTPSIAEVCNQRGYYFLFDRAPIHATSVILSPIGNELQRHATANPEGKQTCIFSL
jgi:hypothetical protein